MSQTRTFELRARWIVRVNAKLKIARLAERSGLTATFKGDFPLDKILRITLTGNVDALDDLVWTLRDEFGERLREVRG